MTGQERDYDAVLSRVLHSTTDQIEPVGDGLTKIQARLAEPWLRRQWWLLRSEFTVLGWVVAVRCQSWFNTIRSGSAAGADARDGATTAAGAGAAGYGGRRRPRPVLGGVVALASAKHLRKPAGPRMTWLRPALAVAGTVVLVVAGVFAMTGLRGTLAALANEGSPGTATSSNAGAPGSTNGHGGRAVQGGQSSGPGAVSSAKHGSSPHASVSPSPSACSSPSTQPAASPSPTSASPSPSPSPTSASPTPTTPSPSPSTSTGSVVGGQTSGSQTGDIGTTAFVVCQHTIPSPQSSPTNQATASP